MASPKSIYTCNACGATSPRWLGKCPGCGAWNTLVESAAESAAPGKNRLSAGFAALAPSSAVQALAEIEAVDVPRTPTGQGELDRVLGGGIVPGGVVLIGGDPGIGKSTLLLQALDALQRASLPTLYVTGEESGAQVALRARRLGITGSQVAVLAEIQLEKIIATLAAQQPAVAVIDSIQTVYSDQLTSAPGSVAQVRECAAHLTRWAKASGCAIVLVGHVTKDGQLAGPRVLEHMVDTVLYFEGDTHSSFRLVRAIKNRFGAVNEIGVFAMTEKGLKGVSNPSAIFLSQHAQPVPGSCVLVTLEGTRPMLVEIQALVDGGGPSPRRLSVGLERDRLAMLLAVLHRHAGVACGRPGRVRQRRRRRAHQRAGGRPGGAAGHLQQPARPAPAQGLHRLRRGGPGWRGAAGPARAGTVEGGGQAGLFRRRGAQGQRAEEGRRRAGRADHPRGGAGGRGDGGGAAIGLSVRMLLFL